MNGVNIQHVVPFGFPFTDFCFSDLIETNIQTWPKQAFSKFGVE